MCYLPDFSFHYVISDERKKKLDSDIIKFGRVRACRVLLYRNEHPTEAQPLFNVQRLIEGGRLCRTVFSFILYHTPVACALSERSE